MAKYGTREWAYGVFYHDKFHLNRYTLSSLWRKKTAKFAKF